MKRLYFLAIPILLFAASSSCKKVSGPANGHSIVPNNNRDSLVSLSAVVNGTAWQTDSAFAYLIKTSGNDSLAASLMISAVSKVDSANPVARSISFYITNYIGPATYPVNPPYNTITYYQGAVRHFATTGQIIITADTAYSLIGTFNFVADTMTVDSGVFNVAIP